MLLTCIFDNDITLYVIYPIYLQKVYKTVYNNYIYTLNIYTI